MTTRIIFSLFSIVCTLSATAQTVPQLGKNSNREVISAMTLEEKVRLLVGNGFSAPGLQLPPEMAPPAEAGVVGEKVLGAAGSTAAYPRLGIPSVVVTDGPAGVRIAPTRPNDAKTYFCTAFPIATSLASTWDLDLVRKTGEAMGEEVKQYGNDVLLAPGMNIHRNPLGGRNFEYYSEDPLIAGKMAAAMVTGIQSNGVGTSVKHFVANNQETSRMLVDEKISQRALREIYLRGFEIVIKEAKPWTVMSSYNKVNGLYTSQNSQLLRNILRGDWGYEGLVMSDWYGGDNAVEQLKAGNELLMPGTAVQVNAVMEAVKKGTLSEQVLDTNLDVLFNFIKKTPSFSGFAYTNQPDLKAHAKLVRMVAAEGMVLLKNDNNLLPFPNSRRLAVFGNYSYNLISGGTGSGDVNEEYTITLPQGLQNAGFKMDETLRATYEKYIADEKAKFPKGLPFFIPPPTITEMPIDEAQLDKALTADLAIITIGRLSGEFLDRKAVDGFYLTAGEQEMIKKVSKAFHAKGKKVVVILNIGGTIETVSWRDQADAIVNAWLPGQEAGNSIADVLTGKTNPSGKLTTTFLKKYEDDPTAATFPGKATGPAIIQLGFPAEPLETEYSEGIYVGYRAFDKRNITPAYEFGFGKSFTTFDYSNISTSGTRFKGKMTVSVTVKNTGKTAGREVAQLYISAPGKDMDKPEKELKGFAKSKLLKPGESQVLTFELDDRAFTSFDEKTAAWVAEQGKYDIKVGASSRDVRAKATLTMPKKLVISTKATSGIRP